ncbi:MAG: GNAT family N-acetyltransferase, partial [Candidatus Acidiferrales bacterium]
MLYRIARQSDVPAMARLRAANLPSEEAWTARIASYLAKEHHPRHALHPRVAYVALNSRAVVGYIAGHLTRRYDCDGELQWINVTPEQRGTGVAAELLRRLARWFVKQKALRVCVDVEPTNAVARRFYKKHGAQTLSDHWLFWPDIGIAIRKPHTKAQAKKPTAEFRFR